MSAHSEKIARAKQQGLYKVADLLGKEVTHTISHLLEDAAMFNREIDVLCFVDTARQLQVNITNGDWLINNFGEDPNDWAGHRVTLYVGQYDFGDKKQGIMLKRADGGVTVGGNAARAAPKRSPKEDIDDEITF
jgi:hypothetical protein